MEIMVFSWILSETCDSPAQNFRFPVLKIPIFDEEIAKREGVGTEICIEILGCSWI